MSNSLNLAGVRPTLMEAINGKADLSTFAQLLTSSKASEIFDEQREFTVLAPNNDAFQTIPAVALKALMDEADQTGLKRLLAYHILPGRKTAAAMSGLPTASTVAGPTVNFSDRGGLKVNGAAVLLRNIDAVNGVIHIIDTVLELPAAVAATK